MYAPLTNHPSRFTARGRAVSRSLTSLRSVTGRTVRALTLVEVILVVGMLVVLTALAMPRLTQLFEREQLPGSARQLRSLVTLVRAHAAYDGKRYRIRFPEHPETDPMGGDRQPIIEREDDPFHFPEVYEVVTEPWAIGTTLLEDVWVAEVRRGRPTIEELQRLRRNRSEVETALVREYEDDIKHFDPNRPPLEIHPDGTSDWATFVLTQAPRDTSIEDLEEFPRIELIVDGMTGLAWMQRPFYDEELDLFEEKGWPAVLRQDFLTTRMLTEDDVLELHEFRLRSRSGGDRAENGDGNGLPEGFEYQPEEGK
jgi:type II secretory pathway pseudopilin PulG